MKKNLKISIISIVCLAVIVCGVFAACSSKSSSTETTTSKSSTGATGAINVVSREEGSGTRDAFTELMEITDADGNDATTQSAEITNSTSVMMSTVQGNKNAIGYVSLGSLSDSVKALKLNGVTPSTDTVKDGTYTLQRPFNIAYIDGSLSEVAQDFVNFVMSDQGKAIIDEEGYIGIETTNTYTSSKLSGTVTLAGSTSVAPVMNVIADKYKELNPNVKVEIQESGSSAGIESAMEGAVDIAMSSRDLKDDEAKKLKSEKIALDGIAIIVNQENTLDDITSDQVKNIFLGNTTAWEDVK